MRSRVFTGNASFSVHLSGRLARLPRAITSFFAHLTALAGRHLRWKIVLPYAFLALVLGCAATYLATGVITSSLSERADNQLIESARVSSDTLARLERKHLETVRAIMFSDGVSAAIEARDSGQLNALVQGTAANSELQYLQVLDASGQRLTAVRLSAAQTLEYSDITDSDTPASWPPVQQAVATASTHGGKATAIVQTAGGPAVYTAGAVQSGERVIRVVLVGTSLQTLVGQMKNESLADVTIYADEGSPSATSFVHPSEASAKDG